MNFICLVIKICGYYNKGVNVQLIRSKAYNIFEGGKTVPLENVYTQKITIKTLEITKMKRRELLNYTKEL